MVEKQSDSMALARMAVGLVRSRAGIQDSDVAAFQVFNTGILTQAVSAVVGEIDYASPMQTRLATLLDHLANFATVFIWALHECQSELRGGQLDEDSWLQVVMDTSASSFLDGLRKAGGYA